MTSHTISKLAIIILVIKQTSEHQQLIRVDETYTQTHFNHHENS